MRRVLIFLTIVVTALGAPARASGPRPGELGSREAVLGWINGYRAHPDRGHVPGAVQTMSRLGLFKDSENAGAFIGFMAGVLAANPGEAERLVGRMLPLPPEDQWAVVQAIAYSELPNWKSVLREVAPRLPARRLMIDKYLAGELPTLDQAGFESKPGTLSKIGSYLGNSFGLADKPAKKTVLEPSAGLLDVLWGYYCATGWFNPAISHIIALVSWAKDKDDVEKLTLGAMAKYTLASNAARDAKLLGMLKSVAKDYPKDIKASLDEVIEAAETVDLAPLHREALASIEELKRKGPAYKREVSLWGQIGEGALALGCIGAAAAGQVELGIPCVVGGAVSSAGLRYWDTQQ